MSTVKAFLSDLRAALLVALIAAALPSPTQAASYYGGELKNHGHSIAPGDGGPLTNVEFVGNITTTGTITAENVEVNGSFQTTRLSASTMTIQTVSGDDGLEIRTPSGDWTQIRGDMISVDNGGAYPAIRVLDGNYGNNTLQASIALIKANYFEMKTDGSGRANERFILMPGGDSSIVPPASSGVEAYDALIASPSVIIWNSGSINESNTTIGKVAVRGSYDGTHAPKGYWGEYISTQAISVGATDAPATTVWGNFLSTGITPGNWDLTGIVRWRSNGSTVSAFQLAISTHGGNVTDDHLLGTNLLAWTQAYSTDTVQCYVLPNYRLILPSTGAYATDFIERKIFLKVRYTYSAGTPQTFNGSLQARRVP